MHAYIYIYTHTYQYIYIYTLKTPSTNSYSIMSLVKIALFEITRWCPPWTRSKWSFLCVLCILKQSIKYPTVKQLKSFQYSLLVSTHIDKQCICMYIYIYAHMHSYTYIYTPIYLFIYLFTYTYIDIYMYMHMHTCMIIFFPFFRVITYGLITAEQDCSGRWETTSRGCRVEMNAKRLQKLETPVWSVAMGSSLHYT